ncbi:MAG: peptide MFS transporter [Gemmataceae bacterium]|nr:peptide MFS transporter [Gemmataceae bacterium]
MGLYVLFFTEMWERFGFYCMEAVFVYYMKVSQYEFLRENSSRIYGMYLAGVYFTPFFGGLLSEWRLGYFLSIILGGLLMAGGYGLLALEPAVCFAVGLALIILGNGLFKPNISSLVGKLYPPGDSRVDSAFTIFYMGINIGALFSPIVAGVVGNLMAQRYAATTDVADYSRWGYLTVFLIAAIGMVIGEVIFLFGKRWVRVAQTSPATAQTISGEVDPVVQRRRNFALIIFFGINVLFWMAFKQRANSMALWIKDRTVLDSPEWLTSGLGMVGLDKLMLKDGQIAKELFQALNPLFVILLSPAFVWLWAALKAVRINVPTPAKLVLGFALLAGSFLLMWQVADALPSGARAPASVIVWFYLLLTASELCLSPMGLSLVSKLAPARTRAIWMGLFFISTSVGGLLSGEIYQYFKSMEFGVFFRSIMMTSLGAMFLMCLAYPLISRALRTDSSGTGRV